MTKKICFFGSYDPEYPRNILTKKAIEGIGYKVIECNDRSGGLMHYFRLVSKFLKTTKSSRVVVIPVLGHYDVPIAWILAKLFNKKIIFDAFYSLYETYVEDRKQIKSFSFAALRFYIYDWLSPRLADKVIFDTKEHIEYFHKNYGVKYNKMFELPVTANPDIFKFRPPKKQQNFTIGFYGSFMPLHGVDVIVKSFKYHRSTNIKCLLFGIGPGIDDTKKLIKKLEVGKNVILTHQKVEYSKLPNYFEKIDLFLAGPFGLSDKAKRVVPAKIPEALCAGIPIIVAKTLATSRLLSNMNGIIWLDSVSPKNLSRKIEESKEADFKRNIKIRNNFLKSQMSFKSFKTKFFKILSTP